MVSASGSYPKPGDYSQGEPEPYNLRFFSSSPTTQHRPEVLPELASWQEARQEKFPYQGAEEISNKGNKKGSHLKSWECQT